jgi:hypothetical protein
MERHAVRPAGPVPALAGRCWSAALVAEGERGTPQDLRKRAGVAGGRRGSSPIPRYVRYSRYSRYCAGTKVAIAERQKFSALLKMLRAGLTT